MNPETLSGSSRRRQITLSSEHGTATAKWDPEGEISCEFKPRKASLRAKSRFQNKQRGIIWLCVTTLLVTLEFLWLFQNYLNNSVPLPDNEVAPNIWFGSGMVALLTLGIGLSLSLTRRRVASWHAAEHMVIMNYRVNGTADLEQIRQTSPVSIYCGGRFVLPLILCFGLSTALMSSRHIAGPYEAATMTLAYLVTVLWLALVFLLLDACWELGRMPVFGWVTRWIQRRFTTQAPGEAELLTAHRALEELLAAERQTATEAAA